MFGEQKTDSEWTSLAKCVRNTTCNLKKGEGLLKGLFTHLKHRGLVPKTPAGVGRFAADQARHREYTKRSNKTLAGVRREDAMAGLRSMTKATNALTNVMKAITAGASATTGSNMMHAVADGAKTVGKSIRTSREYRNKHDIAGHVREHGMSRDAHNDPSAGRYISPHKK
jgi:hypothetical protein